MNRITKKEEARLERQRCIGRVKELLNGNRKVYTRIDSVSASGMSRQISAFIPVVDKRDGSPDIVNISYYIAKILHNRQGKSGGVIMGGCGMDMGFSMVYNVSSYLFLGGDGKTVTGRNGDTKPETDGGYILQQSWL